MLGKIKTGIDLHRASCGILKGRILAKGRHEGGSSFGKQAGFNDELRTDDQGGLRTLHIDILALAKPY